MSRMEKQANLFRRQNGDVVLVDGPGPLLHRALVGLSPEVIAGQPEEHVPLAELWAEELSEGVPPRRAAHQLVERLPPQADLLQRGLGAADQRERAIEESAGGCGRQIVEGGGLPVFTVCGPFLDLRRSFLAPFIPVFIPVEGTGEKNPTPLMRLWLHQRSHKTLTLEDSLEAPIDQTCKVLARGTKPPASPCCPKCSK